MAKHGNPEDAQNVASPPKQQRRDPAGGDPNVTLLDTDESTFDVSMHDATESPDKQDPAMHTRQASADQLPRVHLLSELPLAPVELQGNLQDPTGPRTARMRKLLISVG